jgi:TM2 domain-containing membrane protein YozV
MAYHEAIGLEQGTADPRLIDAMVTARQRRTSYAYALWLLCGTLGFHNFYLGKPVLGAAQLIGTLAFILIGGRLGEVAAVIMLGLLATVLVTLLIDAFLIPARVRAYSERLRTHLEAEADWRAA